VHYERSMIHKTAIVEPGAKIAEDVEIGAYSVIDKHVSIGSGTRIGNHSVITGKTVIGKTIGFFITFLSESSLRTKNMMARKQLWKLGMIMSFGNFVHLIRVRSRIKSKLLLVIETG